MVVPEEALAVASAVDLEAVGEGEATMMVPQTMSFVSGRHCLVSILSTKYLVCVNNFAYESHELIPILLV